MLNILFVFIFLRTILRFFALHKNSSLLLAWDFRTLAKITRVGSPLYANSMLPSICFPPPHPIESPICPRYQPKRTGQDEATP